ncbi:MAG: hypothetical protein ACTHU0_34610 [Kofleriaceae bacterium]
MKIHGKLLGISALLLATASPALADTRYHYSGQACQPQTPTDASNLVANGAGASILTNVAYSTIAVSCPVMAIQNSSQATALRVMVHGGVAGFWTNSSFATLLITWASSTKVATGSGITTLSWTGTELPTTMYLGSYAFMGTIDGCDDENCFKRGTIAAYEVAHVLP